MSLTCKFEELDPETRDHLLAVRRAGGRGAPGIYTPLGNSKPGCAIVLGPLVILFALATAAVSHKSPAAVAALQTAGVLTGGWLIVYAFRRWLLAGNAVYPGRFVYFDPLHVYEVQGENVRVTPLDGVNSILAVTGPAVAFKFARGNAVRVAVPTARTAGRVEEYYGAMEELEADKAGRWANGSTAELGAAAVYAAAEEKLPRDTGDIRLDFDSVPEEPTKARRAAWGFVGLLLVPTAGAALFALFFAMNHATRDSAAFADAQKGGAPGLRAYLLDERNVKHRDEAKQLLAQHYNAPIAKLKSLPPGSEPALRDGMIHLVESLRDADTPAVSIRVTDGGGETARSKAIQQDVADSLARTVGPELMAFAAAPPETPAMIEVTCSTDPETRQTATAIVIRTSPTGNPVVTRAISPVPDGSDYTAVRNIVLIELAGGYVPAPPVDLGDF